MWSPTKGDVSHPALLRRGTKVSREQLTLRPANVSGHGQASKGDARQYQPEDDAFARAAEEDAVAGDEAEDSRRHLGGCGRRGEEVDLVDLPVSGAQTVNGAVV